MFTQTYKSGLDWASAPSFAAGRFWQQSAAKPRLFPEDVPAMPATILGLELLLQELLVDLHMVAELVLSDLGATIQILRLIGTQFEHSEDRPSRMEDCIASLDVEDWFGAVSAATFAGKQSAATQAWKHARDIAQCARLIAGSLDGVRPEEAYLVGLLHEIHTIPAILNWQTRGADASELATMLAAEWSLPPFVSGAQRGPRGVDTSWRGILSAAHELARAPGEI